MDGFAVLLAVIVGWLLSQLSLTLYSKRERVSRLSEDKRQLYARFLAAGEGCRRAADDVMRWDELSTQKARGGGVQELARMTAEINEHLRSSRLLFAEMRLLAPEDVLDAADQYHRAAEEAVLMIRFAGPSTQLNDRRMRLAQAWEVARDSFQAAARGDLGERVTSRMPRLFSRREPG